MAVGEVVAKTISLSQCYSHDNGKGSYLIVCIKRSQPAQLNYIFILRTFRASFARH